MSEASTLFIASVQEAVQSSITSNKPLFVFISDESTTSNTFFEKYLGDQDLCNSLELNLVCLKLIKGSQECGFFEQIFPNTIVPSFYIIKQGALLDTLYGEIELPEFKKRLENIITAQKNQQNANTTPGTNFTASTQEPQSNIPEQSTSNNQSTFSAASSPTPSSSASSTPVSNRTLNETKRKPARSLKEEAAEVTAKKYKEEALKQKKQAQEERSRILKLLEADKEERRLREKRSNEKRENKEKSNDEQDKVKNEEVVENVHHSHKHTKCILAIRLFDGVSLRHEFDAKETLNDVRTWVDQNRSDGDDPYAFHRAVPRVTYGDSEELESLGSLNLTPRSALILKPVIRNVTKSYQAQNSWLSAGLSKIGVALSSFVYGHGPEVVDEVPPQVHSRSASPVQATSPPIFSVGPNGPLHSTPSLLNLTNSQLQVNNGSSSNNSEEIISSRSTTPRPISSAHGSQARVRTLHDDNEDKKKDERLTYNGNRLNLEDNKKK